jgi:bacteriocin-like protein
MSGMKKTTTPAKLTLKLETMKTLRTTELTQVIGGATTPCAHPTTTVLTLGGC